jgi:transketolase
MIYPKGLFGFKSISFNLFVKKIATRGMLMEEIPANKHLMRTGMIKLLEIKDSDIRIMTLKQCRDAVDKSIHIGGAFSAIIPLVTLFYSRTIKLDIANPTKRGQDMFILSKGHSIASLASIFSDLGYFDRSTLQNSRSAESILNGHPGPLLPGCHISTGPLGQGLGVAQGLALVGKKNPTFDVFCLTGDGELQEGPIWEALMYSGYRRLDNLCVLVDQNYGQADDTKQLVVPLTKLSEKFASFGWQSIIVDATQYSPVLHALQEFKSGLRNGCPTAIICTTKKGYGGFSDFTNKHKFVVPDKLNEQELALQEQRRVERINEFVDFFNNVDYRNVRLRNELKAMAGGMNLDFIFEKAKIKHIMPVIASTKTRRAPAREKKIKYNASLLPQLEKSRKYSAQEVIGMAMKAFAQDNKIVSIDADLSTTSDLAKGVGSVDVARALNVCVAESNMMNIAEGFAVMGYNVWTSTFCPFWDWKVLRRIAISYQERIETIKKKKGWLSEGHGLDITFLATAPDLETTTNGATHMGNDDTLVFDAIAHLKIITISCPNQLLAAMKWIMEGNRGLVYLRVMRAPSAVIYDNDCIFNMGKGYFLRQNSNDKAVIISSGRGVHEALSAADGLNKMDIPVGVVDMPSIDESLLLNLYDSKKWLIFAEQNNGYIWSKFQEILFKTRNQIDVSRLVPINTIEIDGQPRFIHSATYLQLLNQFGLSPVQLMETIKQKLIRN